MRLALFLSVMLVLPLTLLDGVEPRIATIEFFGQKGPASTMIEVSKLAHPDYLIEVEAVAVV